MNWFSRQFGNEIRLRDRTENSLPHDVGIVSFIDIFVK